MKCSEIGKALDNIQAEMQGEKLSEEFSAIVGETPQEKQATSLCLNFLRKVHVESGDIPSEGMEALYESLGHLGEHPKSKLQSVQGYVHDRAYGRVEDKKQEIAQWKAEMESLLG